MLRTYKDQNFFREQCIWDQRIDYWDMYIDLETDDDDYNELVYKKIEERLCEWLAESCKEKVFYNGDLNFEFESDKERDAFDAEFGDPVAFKLTFV